VPYLGARHSEEQIRAGAASGVSGVELEQCADPAGRAGADLAADRVIGWFEGGSEAGPRALGHRSILADPRPAGKTSSTGSRWPAITSRSFGRRTCAG
jgi:carbamoyltransferase